MGDDLSAKIQKAEREARQAAALAREKGIATHDAQTLPRTRTDAPLRPSAGGERLAFGSGESGPCWLLEGRELAVGDVIEVYTNAANGWIRGRFAWSGGDQDPPRLVINLWDANGARDEDGVPPFVGELDAALPRGATCRAPAPK